MSTSTNGESQGADVISRPAAPDIGRTSAPPVALADDIPPNIRAALYKQEHRLVPVIFNLFNTRHLPKGDPRRAGAVYACIYYFFSPSAAAKGGIGLAGILGIYLAWQANNLLSAQNRIVADQTRLLESQNAKLDEQNQLMTSQNKNIEMQTGLMESARCSNLLAVQLPPLLNDDSISKNPENTAARLASLTLQLTPYHFIRGKDGKRQFLSPERGQILVAALRAKVPLKLIAKSGGTFEWADLSGQVLDLLECEGLSFNNADFTESSVTHATFKKCQFLNAVVDHTDFKESRFYWCAFFIEKQNLDATKATFRECDFLSMNTSAQKSMPFAAYDRDRPRSSYVSDIPFESCTFWLSKEFHISEFDAFIFRLCKFNEIKAVSPNELDLSEFGRWRRTVSSLPIPTPDPRQPRYDLLKKTPLSDLGKPDIHRSLREARHPPFASSKTCVLSTFFPTCLTTAAVLVFCPLLFAWICN